MAWHGMALLCELGRKPYSQLLVQACGWGKGANTSTHLTLATRVTNANVWNACMLQHRLDFYVPDHVHRIIIKYTVT